MPRALLPFTFVIFPNRMSNSSSPYASFTWRSSNVSAVMVVNSSSDGSGLMSVTASVVVVVDGVVAFGFACCSFPSRNPLPGVSTSEFALSPLTVKRNKKDGIEIAFAKKIIGTDEAVLSGKSYEGKSRAM